LEKGRSEPTAQGVWGKDFPQGLAWGMAWSGFKSHHPPRI
jgi:hypothetical protein